MTPKCSRKKASQLPRRVGGLGGCALICQSMNLGIANSQEAASSLVVLPLSAVWKEQSAWVWEGEGFHGWDDGLNQAILS